MKVGIIGCGRIAQVHLTALRSLPWVEMVGVCDTNPQAAQATAQRFGIEGVYASPEELFRRAEPQAVHVLTPPHTHAALVRLALEAGVHVFVEKPMTTSTAEAEALCALARQQRVSLCVDHNRLFDPVVKQALALALAGKIGDVVSVETYQGFQRQALLDGAARGSQHSAAEAFYNLAIHSVYLQLAFLGSMHRLEVMGRKTGRLSGSFAEECRVLLEGKKALGYLCFSVDIQPHLNALHIYGTTGSLFLNLNTMTLVSHTASRLPKLLQKGAYNITEALQLLTAAARNAALMAMRRLTLYPGIAEVIRRFYTSLEQGTFPPVSAEEGCEAVRVLEQIYARAAQEDLDKDVTERASGKPSPMLLRLVREAG
ncbi:MAG: Gfo/Idh/MocA family oxidoreductase [Deltaproteobacteria bacterium]|nr:Gfo/Idh/MocA family oxidoreductase [Deltaproteobacteria bacterium]